MSNDGGRLKIKDEYADLEGGSDDENRGKKLSHGRRKIVIEFIKNKGRRHITFSKRKMGIMKKAYELSVLTGTDMLLLIASETGHVYTFATPKLQPMITTTEGKNMIQQCLNAPDHRDEKKEEQKQPQSQPQQQQQQQAPPQQQQHKHSQRMPPTPEQHQSSQQLLQLTQQQQQHAMMQQQQQQLYTPQQVQQQYTAALLQHQQQFHERQYMQRQIQQQQLGGGAADQYANQAQMFPGYGVPYGGMAMQANNNWGAAGSGANMRGAAQSNNNTNLNGAVNPAGVRQQQQVPQQQQQQQQQPATNAIAQSGSAANTGNSNNTKIQQNGGAGQSKKK